jgi:DNA (cytosine-5)-methyltransferase 1
MRIVLMGYEHAFRALQKTSISNGRYGHFDVSQQRGISLREAAALQSFPDDYVFHPTDQIEPVARMIGNAVPPKLARYFASYLVNSLDR